MDESPVQDEVRMGRRIQMRLDELGWKQSDLLARVQGLSKGTLSAMIASNRIASEWSDEIAEALGVEHRWLQKGTEPKLRISPRTRNDPRTILWQNLVRLMEWRYGSEKLAQLARDCGFGQATSTRLKGQDTWVRLDLLEAIASRFGFEVWQILVPDFDPRNPPVIDTAAKRR